VSEKDVLIQENNVVGMEYYISKKPMLNVLGEELNQIQ